MLKVLIILHFTIFLEDLYSFKNIIYHPMLVRNDTDEIEHDRRK
jgi:hypothetical protein